MLNKDNQEIKSDKLEFNTYCTFKKEKRDISEVIGLMFKDYIESLKIEDK